MTVFLALSPRHRTKQALSENFLPFKGTTREEKVQYLKNGGVDNRVMHKRNKNAHLGQRERGCTEIRERTVA